MSGRVHQNPQLIYSIGTQIVIVRDVIGRDGQILHHRGTVGVVVHAPADLNQAYRIRFPDGREDSLMHDLIKMRALFIEGKLGDQAIAKSSCDLYERVILRCIIGSRAYGLDDDQSDTDYRGVFLPPAELHWSLYGVPEQIERDETQEHYWEFQRFLILALKANPNVLECLYSPLVEKQTLLGEELLQIRSSFLSRRIYQTYNGYAMSQFKKMQADLRNQGQVKWKHVMHLIRLLISGIRALYEGVIPVQVDEHRDPLMAIKRGEMPWDEIERWRLSLHADFDRALEATKLPDGPDYEQANSLLIKARHAALSRELP